MTTSAQEANMHTIQATAADTRLWFSALPRCPTCGEPVVAAQAAEFVDTGEIRHHWVCDDCGQAFSTTVTFG
jgi:uncharacterized protein with PIN domain